MQGTQGGNGGGGNTIENSLLDDIIRRLLDIRSVRPGKQAQLSEAEIKQLCVASREIFMQQPNLLELEAPIKICGIIGFFFAPKFLSCKLKFKLRCLYTC